MDYKIVGWLLGGFLFFGLIYWWMEVGSARMHYRQAVKEMEALKKRLPRGRQ
jgi:hypothetical protein